MYLQSKVLNKSRQHGRLLRLPHVKNSGEFFTCRGDTGGEKVSSPDVAPGRASVLWISTMESNYDQSNVVDNCVSGGNT